MAGQRGGGGGGFTSSQQALQGVGPYGQQQVPIPYQPLPPGVPRSLLPPGYFPPMGAFGAGAPMGMGAGMGMGPMGQAMRVVPSTYPGAIGYNNWMGNPGTQFMARAPMPWGGAAGPAGVGAAPGSPGGAAVGAS